MMMAPAFTLSLTPAWSWSPGLMALLALALLFTGLVITMLRAGKRLADRSRSRRWAVLLLNLLAFALMVALLAPPSKEVLVDETVLLLTEGASLEELPSDRPVFATAQIDADALPPRVQQLSLPGQLIWRVPDFAHLELRGHGLSAEEWQQLPTDLTVYYQPPPLEGPVDVQWPRLLVAGQPLRISGRLELPESDRVARLVLLDPTGLPVDETSARSGQHFALEAVPKLSGASEYRLQTWRSDGLVSEEPLGVFVQPNDGARILILQSAPSFESRSLATWAADRGNEVVILTEISKDRTLSQGFNLSADEPLTLNPERLGRTDLVVSDGRGWTGLGNAQRQLILDEVRQGAGLLLIADRELSEYLSGPAGDELGFLLEPGEPDLEVWPVWPGSNPQTPLPLLPWRIEGEVRTLTRSESGITLDAWQPLGAGRVALTVLRERHRWFTAGDNSNASRYWSFLLRELARPLNRSNWLSPAARGQQVVGSIAEFCATAADNTEFKMTSASGYLPGETGTLVAHADGFPVACGRARPPDAGWYQLTFEGAAPDIGSGLSVRIYGEDEWLTARRYDRQQDTLERLSPAKAAATTQRTLSQPLTPGWLLLLLLIFAGALWLERRLFDLE